MAIHAAGKGHFHFAGETTGGTFAIELPTKEIDDVLRAGVTYDPLGPVRVQMQAARDPRQPMPPAIQTKTFGDVLLSIKGSPATITGNDGSVLKGRIVSIELKPQMHGDEIVQSEYLTILTDNGLQTMSVASIQTIDPTDPDLRQRLQESLAAQVEPSQVETTEIEFHFSEGETREVHIGVMRSMPMWKSAYRLENGQLIHRSIVENMSGMDWEDVDLRLFDGNPVLFEMELRSIAIAKLPIRSRPIRHAVVPDTFAQAKLTIEEKVAGDQSTLEDSAAMTPSINPNQGMKGMNGRYGMGGGGMGGGMGGFGGGAFGGGVSGVPALGANNAEPTSPAAQAFDGEVAAVDGTPAGSLMAFSFDNVRLRQGRMTMLDTVIENVEIQSRSVYRHSYHPTKPLLSMSIKNKTNALLPAGPVSIMLGDRFRMILGEAIMPSVGPDAEQVLGFATDGGIRVEHENPESTTEMLAIEHKSDLYQFVVQSRQEWRDVYQIANRSGEDRNLSIEHSAPDSPYQWKGVKDESVAVLETTDGYRLQLTMKSGDQESVVATSEFEQTEVFPFSTIDIGLLRRWKSDETWDQDSTALISEVLEHRERLLKLVDQIQSNLIARAEMIIEIERVTSQLSRRMNVSLPTSIRSNYQKRLIYLEERKLKLGRETKVLADQRQEILQDLGVDPKLRDTWQLQDRFSRDLDAALIDAMIDAGELPEPPEPESNDPFGGN